MTLVSRTRLATLMVVTAAVVAGLFGAVPVWPQTQNIEALQISEAIPFDDPWDAVWERVQPETVPLSAQNVAPPFGGGAVSFVDVRAVHDGSRLYLHLEWPDTTLDDGVAGQTDFTDAAAVQFPIVEGAPYTMGGPGTPVNIWHWKAVWQTDLAEGFQGTESIHPNTYVDFYPPDDPLYRPAEETGNPLAQRSHPSPIENLVAEGFGTLTSSDTQDVVGAGAWQDGTWRALFARDLTPAVEGMAAFIIDSPTMVAFAIWEGQNGDRDGLKSIAQFVELSLSSEKLPVGEPARTGAGIWVALAVFAIVVAFIARMATLGRPSEPSD